MTTRKVFVFGLLVVFLLSSSGRASARNVENEPVPSQGSALQTQGNAPGDADHDGILDSYEKELINTYAPVLKFHLEDCTRPVSVDWYLKGPTTYLAHAQNEDYGDWNNYVPVIAAGQINSGSALLGHTRTTRVARSYYNAQDVVENSGSGSFSSHFYLSYDDEYVYPNGLHAFCGDFSTATIYAHVTRASPIGAYNVAYHIFYPWNGQLCFSSGICGGSHQGDWELVFVRAYPGNNSANQVYLSSHDGGGWFTPDVTISMANIWGYPVPMEGTRPIVYVARDSHANYAYGGIAHRPWNRPDDHSCWEDFENTNCLTYDSWSGDYFWLVNGIFGYDGTAVPDGSEIVNVGEYAYPAAGMEWINFSGRWGEAVSSSTSDTCKFCQGPYGPKFDPIQPPTIITKRPPDQSAVAGVPKKFEFGAGTFDFEWDDVVSMPIDWGDGTKNDISYWAGGLKHFIPSHTYSQPGIYYVSYNLYARNYTTGVYSGWDGWVFAVNVIGDADNIPDQVEDGAPNSGDGNGDGIPDSRQANVASLPVAGGSYVTLESPVGTSLADVSTRAVPLEPPSGIEFPLGALDFVIQDVTESTATVRLFLQPGVEINTFYKYGPTPEDATDHWYEFLHTGSTGAKITGNLNQGYTIILHFLDNGRGDSDPAVGVIRDPGAPGHDPDSTPPVISANVTGTPELNGWYRSDVLVSWSVNDEESTILSQDGCGETKIDFDTVGTTLTCTATSLGGTASQSVTILRDTLAPTITFAGRTQPNSNGWNNTDVNVKWNCTDITSGPAAETVSLDLTGEGANQSATGTCSDNAGNTAQDTQTGISIDLTAPELDPLVLPDPVLLHGLALAVANATDPLSGVAVENCGLPDTDTVGLKSLTCTASDLAGNSSSADATYHVIYDFTGFFPPLGDPLLVYETKAGSTVPVKFSLAGYQGLGIFASGYPAVIGGVVCDTWINPAAIMEVQTPGNSGLSYDFQTGMYIFRWKTDTTWSGTCRRLIVGFIDGRNYALIFKFK
jgi:hypothetical protein